MENHKLLYGDFDQDGIHNLDDPHPFKQKKDKKPMSEISLTDELQLVNTKAKKTNKDLNTFVEEIKPLVPKSGHVTHRVKNMPSIVNKLRRKTLDNIGDLGGARITVKSHKDLKSVQKKLKTKLGKKITKEEDFYTTPNPHNADYRGVHFDILEGKSKLELQLKTARVSEVTEAYHSTYKTTPTKKSAKIFKEIMQLAVKADGGDIKAQKQFDKLKISPEIFK